MAVLIKRKSYIGDALRNGRKLERVLRHYYVRPEEAPSKDYVTIPMSVLSIAIGSSFLACLLAPQSPFSQAVFKVASEVLTRLAP